MRPCLLSYCPGCAGTLLWFLPHSFGDLLRRRQVMSHPIRPLLAAYGGGHVQIVAAIAHGFLARGIRPDVIGFTTAYADLCRQGIEAQPVSTLLDRSADEEWLALAEKLTSGVAHPDVSASETIAYFAIGLRDLAQKIGREAALVQVKAEGRTVFEPIDVMRRYLRKTRPDIVITTTSPRFELALLKAARLEGVPSLAVGDLFLVKERDWILQPGYSEHIAVLSGEVASSLIEGGFPESGIRITGNPAFDRLAPQPEDDERRTALRAQLRLEDKNVILFPVPGGRVSGIGRPFLAVNDVVAAFESFCRADSRNAYVIRKHPNLPLKLPDGVRHGILDDGSLLSPEDAILVSDIVCVEVSTMGLQAALVGRPVIWIGFSDYVLFPQYGLGQAAADLSETLAILRADPAKETSRSGKAAGFEMPPLGSATKNVLAYVETILSQHAGSLSPVKKNDGHPR